MNSVAAGLIYIFDKASKMDANQLLEMQLTYRDYEIYYIFQSIIMDSGLMTTMDGSLDYVMDEVNNFGEKLKV